MRINNCFFFLPQPAKTKSKKGSVASADAAKTADRQSLQKANSLRRRRQTAPSPIQEETSHRLFDTDRQNTVSFFFCVDGRRFVVKCTGYRSRAVCLQRLGICSFSSLRVAVCLSVALVGRAGERAVVTTGRDRVDGVVSSRFVLCICVSRTRWTGWVARSRDNRTRSRAPRRCQRRRSRRAPKPRMTSRSGTTRTTGSTLKRCARADVNHQSLQSDCLQMPCAKLTSGVHAAFRVA